MSGGARHDGGHDGRHANPHADPHADPHDAAEVLVLRRDTSAIGAARRWVSAKLAARAVAPQRCEDALLVVSELVTNALRHGDGKIEARVSVDRAGVALFVSDDGRDLPAVRRGDVSASGGLGLQIVDRLASRWGVTPRADGKTVWVVLADSSPHI
jgi:anti-sigma regulatory factor (Ser/Thr protein kinase)